MDKKPLISYIREGAFTRQWFMQAFFLIWLGCAVSDLAVTWFLSGWWSSAGLPLAANSPSPQMIRQASVHRLYAHIGSTIIPSAFFSLVFVFLFHLLWGRRPNGSRGAVTVLYGVLFGVLFPVTKATYLVQNKWLMTPLVPFFDPPFNLTLPIAIVLTGLQGAFLGLILHYCVPCTDACPLSEQSSTRL